MIDLRLPRQTMSHFLSLLNSFGLTPKDAQLEKGIGGYQYTEVMVSGKLRQLLYISHELTPSDSPVQIERNIEFLGRYLPEKSWVVVFCKHSQLADKLQLPIRLIIEDEWVRYTKRRFVPIEDLEGLRHMTESQQKYVINKLLWF